MNSKPVIMVAFSALALGLGGTALADAQVDHPADGGSAH